MTYDPQSPHEPAESDVPDALRRALRNAAEPGFPVPPTVDAALRLAAERRFRSARRRRVLRLALPLSAAAAVLWIAIAPSLTSYRRSLAPAAPVVSHVRPTILDAFALARRLKAHEPPQPQWDCNSDGVVDERDVTALAMAAVRLEDGT